MRIAAHQDPVWRSRADYIFQAYVDGDPDYREQLWGRLVAPGVAEICCIPFLLRDLALGDVVRMDDRSILEGTVERSGRVAFRFWFHEPDAAARDELLARLSALGALTEFSSRRLLAVDAQDRRLAVTVASVLAEFEERGIGAYETADTVVPDASAGE
jgi:Domain of unknown function (DUF4265)